jgi:iron complex outermembrane receptor protein
MSYRELSNRTICSAVALAVSAALATGVANAQTAAAGATDAQTTAAPNDQLQEVVVTAERRTNDIQKVANSITVRTGADLQQQGKYSLAQILEDVPGVQTGTVQVANGGVNLDSAANGLTIRGIPSNVGGGGGAPATVAAAAAVYVDGLYDGIGGNYDVDRVEVLRGPQGTLYGRSATSGLVAYHTANPNLTKLGGNASAEFGNYALMHYSAALNAPLIDNVLALRVAGQRYERNGYFSSDGGALSTTDGRIKALWQPTQDVSLLLGVAVQKNNPHSGGVQIQQPAPNKYSYLGEPVSHGHNDFDQYWAEFNWNLGFATLTWEPAWRTFHSDTTSATLTFTQTGTSLDFHQGSGVTKDHVHSEELRLASNNNTQLSWLAGAFYYDQGLASFAYNNARGKPPGAPAPINFVAFNANLRGKRTQDIGLFLQSTYNLTDTWRLTGGARWDYTKVGVSEFYFATNIITQQLQSGNIPSPTETGIREYKNWTYKARVEHDLSARNMVYASVSTGYSPGDVSLTQDAQNVPYVLNLKAETLTSYEVGSKNRFLNNRLQVNGDAYFYHYGAFQSAGVNCTPTAFTPTSCSLASPAQVTGAELENIFQLTQSDQVGLNFSYSNARFVQKNATLVSVGPATTTFGYFFARDKIPQVVPFSADASYQHVFMLPGDSSLTLHGDARYMSGHDLSNISVGQLAQGILPYLTVGAEVVGDVDLTWASRGGVWSATGYVRNIGNNQYKVSGLAGNGGGLPTASLYDPRTYGVVLNARF